MAARHPITIGERFNRLVVTGVADRIEGGRLAVVCICDCGTQVITRFSYLVDGKKQSCGCLRQKYSDNPPSKHGWSRTRLYDTWNAMLSRVKSPKSLAFKYYGGRGIQVDKGWESFVVFRDWALANGYADDLTIERVDVNGDYRPENCKWIPKPMQERNKRRTRWVTIDGETKCLGEWVAIYGVRQGTVSKRIDRGIDPKTALEMSQTLRPSKNCPRCSGPIPFNMSDPSYEAVAAIMRAIASLDLDELRMIESLVVSRKWKTGSLTDQQETER